MQFVVNEHEYIFQRQQKLLQQISREIMLLLDNNVHGKTWDI